MGTFQIYKQNARQTLQDTMMNGVLGIVKYLQVFDISVNILAATKSFLIK